MQKNIWLFVIGGLCLPLLTSCYTAISAPKNAADLQRERIWASESEEPSPERFREDEAYRYPSDPYGYGAYGRGGAPYGYWETPFIGYDSRGGWYGYGSYGYPAYGSGYGPYGYGSDPYYLDDGGYYIPPGYELLSTRELEDLHDTIRTLTDETGFDEEEERRQSELEEDREAIWHSRVGPARGVQQERPTAVQRPAVSQSSSVTKPANTQKNTEKKESRKESAKRRRR